MKYEDWEEVRLGDVIQIKHGWAFKGKYFSDNGQYILLSPRNFFEEGGFRLRESKEKFYLGEFPKEYLLKKDDLIIAMTEQGAGLLGSPAIIPENERFLHNQRLGLFHNYNEKIILKKYLYYLFFTKNIRGLIAGSATGTKVKHTAPKRIYDISIKLPPLKTQKKIAKILSNYDDLIENNLKQIELLEEKARLTYEEWFLRFRVDGVELEIDSESGLPFGWERVKIGNKVDLKQGFALNKKSKHYIVDKGLPLLKISDLLRETETLFVKETIPKQFLVFENEIIYTRTAQVGYVFMGKRGVVYNNCFKVIPKEKIYTRFIYQYLKLKNIRNFAQSLATGTAQADLNHDTFKSIKIIYPTENFIIKFNEMVEPLYESIQNLKLQNQNLKEARDILLPRLMTGVIEP